MPPSHPAPADRPDPAAPIWDPAADEAAAEARPRRGSRRWWALGAAAVAAAGALTVWFGAAATRDVVGAQVVGYTVADRETTVVLEVSRPEGAAVRCTVSATDRMHARVGTVDLELPAGPERVVRTETSVRTTTPATNVAVRDCAVTP